MKKLYLSWFTFILTTWVGYAGMLILVRMLRGRDIDFAEAIIVGFIVSLFFCFLQIVPIYFNIHRAKYLEINSSEKPSFKVACSSVIDVPQSLDFTLLKNEIANKWLITFSDDVSHVLKFRQKINFLLWWGIGPAAWLKFDAAIGKMELICFPMAGIWENDSSRKLKREIENCLALNIET